MAKRQGPAIRHAHVAKSGGPPNPAAPLSVGSPLIFREMYFETKRSGLEAVAFKDLVQSVLHALSGTTAYVLTSLLHVVHHGDSARMRNRVPHLHLPKEDPRWLVMRTRPIMLEETVCRKESTIMLERMYAIRTAKDPNPPLILHLQEAVYKSTRRPRFPMCHTRMAR